MKRRQNSFITAKRKVFRIRLIALLLLVVWNSLLVNRLRTVRQITTKKVLDKQILSELQYFPLAFQNEHRETTWKAEAVICNYEDSWQSARTFGGARKHEGTDLMTIRNERGIYPIVSMTDGTLEQMGWLKLGGWRIGIRSASGTLLRTSGILCAGSGRWYGGACRAASWICRRFRIWNRRHNRAVCRASARRHLYPPQYG